MEARGRTRLAGNAWRELEAGENNDENTMHPCAPTPCSVGDGSRSFLFHRCAGTDARPREVSLFGAQPAVHVHRREHVWVCFHSVYRRDQANCFRRFGDAQHSKSERERAFLRNGRNRGQLEERVEEHGFCFGLGPVLSLFRRSHGWFRPSRVGGREQDGLLQAFRWSRCFGIHLRSVRFSRNGTHRNRWD